MAYLKPQTPIKLEDNFIYPLTTADQVITSTGERLNSLFKKTIRESATLRAADWSETLPYTQTITLTESTDDYNVDVNIAYNDVDNMTLNKAAGCLSYIKKNHKDITFYCLKSKPTIDIFVEVTGTCRNTIATVEEGTKLNFDIKRYNTEEELLADAPKENTIGIISDVEINGYRFSAIEPESMNEGEIWIKNGTESNVSFSIVDGVTVYPISVKQYINSALVDVTAMSYQDDQWVKWWNGELYDTGNQYQGITGGWIGYGEDGATAKRVTFNTSNISISTKSSYEAASVYTKNKLDLSKFNKLNVELNVTRVNTALSDTVSIGIASVNNVASASTKAVAKHNSKLTGAGTLTCDISVDEGYPYVCANESNFVVSKIWLE